jgi:hypothetical protein
LMSEQAVATPAGVADRIAAAVLAGLGEQWRGAAIAALPGIAPAASPAAAPAGGLPPQETSDANPGRPPREASWSGGAEDVMPAAPYPAAEPAAGWRHEGFDRRPAAAAGFGQRLDGSGARDRSRRELDFERDAERLVRLYQAALLDPDQKPLPARLGLAPEAAQSRRRELWIAAQQRGQAGFAVVPNPAMAGDELGRHLEKLYGLVRQGKVPIGSWRLVTPAWVNGDRAQACHYVPMSLDPSGDFDPGCLERADQGP